MWISTFFNLAVILASVLFLLQSIHENETRAWKVAALVCAFHTALGILLLLWSPIRTPLTWFIALEWAVFLAFLIPFRGRQAPMGAEGYLADSLAHFRRFDERDIVFARNRGLQPGTREYDAYYQTHPEKREYDDRRRTRGGPLGRPGAIDNGHRPNVSMVISSFELPNMLGDKARVVPGEGASSSSYADKDHPPPPASLNPEEATAIVKGWAKQLGADLVGICKVDPRWAYSHRGEIHYGQWEQWGKEIDVPLPRAVVIATEMDHSLVATAPHTPSVVESSRNYARGAYITTILAQWFGAMGYRAVAEHNRHYDLVLVPLAIDAGLGELGRMGYLIADRFGPRVRLFAVQTDMPLVPDNPVDLGVQRFCEICLKCAVSCPSRSISREKERKVDRGIMRWKLNEETCFDYWGKVGTDCCVCMAVCPFSRPNQGVHRLIRYILGRSHLARIVFPYADNLVYGRSWRPRRGPQWVSCQP